MSCRTTTWTRPRSALTCRFTLRLEDAEGGPRETAGRAEFHLGNGKLAAVTVESDGGGA